MPRSRALLLKSEDRSSDHRGIVTCIGGPGPFPDSTSSHQSPSRRAGRLGLFRTRVALRRTRSCSLTATTFSRSGLLVAERQEHVELESRTGPLRLCGEAWIHCTERPTCHLHDPDGVSRRRLSPHCQLTHRFRMRLAVTGVVRRVTRAWTFAIPTALELRWMRTRSKLASPNANVVPLAETNQ